MIKTYFSFFLIYLDLSFTKQNLKFKCHLAGREHETKDVSKTVAYSMLDSECKAWKKWLITVTS